MFRLDTRSAHYTLLAAAHLLLTLPNLGAHTLWDMDEGVNAEAAREMLESGNWITPYYNYQLRTAKPAGLYWFVALSYQVFGVNEFAARLPSVLFGLGSVLLTYELGRRLFSPSAGLMSALVLASSVEFCLISHAVTPDPPLLFFTLLALVLYRFGSEGDRRWWFVPTAAACGMAVLVKGPVGVVLPALIILTHLAWARRLGTLKDWRLLTGVLVFLLVAGPWYGLVSLDTKGKWTQAFFLAENVQRFAAPAEGHRGGPLYHVAGLMALFTPWSLFLPAAVWYAVRLLRRPPAEQPETADGYRYLLAWAGTSLILFSVVATKLPNYVLPMYPAVALLTGRFLDRWRSGALNPPGWVILVPIALCGLIGLALGLAGVWLALAPEVGSPVLAALRTTPVVVFAAGTGVVAPVIALVLIGLVRGGRRGLALVVFTAEAVVFLALLAAIPTVALNPAKAPRNLVEAGGLQQPDHDVRIASYRWLRHSTVFYTRREIVRLNHAAEVQTFLSLERPGYLLVSAEDWADVSRYVRAPARVVARHYDLYARKDILLVVNPWADPERTPDER